MFYGRYNLWRLFQSKFFTLQLWSTFGGSVREEEKKENLSNTYISQPRWRVIFGLVRARGAEGLTEGSVEPRIRFLLHPFDIRLFQRLPRGLMKVFFDDANHKAREKERERETERERERERERRRERERGNSCCALRRTYPKLNWTALEHPFLCRKPAPQSEALSYLPLFLFIYPQERKDFRILELTLLERLAVVRYKATKIRAQ